VARFQSPDGKVHVQLVTRDATSPEDSAARRIAALRRDVRVDPARANAVSCDPVAIAAYLGRSDRFDLAIADFAAAYADQNERHFESESARAEAGLFPPRSGTVDPGR
jgi:hypothetical protein